MGHGDDGIVLSEREREALAGLAESIGDPWLAGQLAGQGQGHAPPKPEATRRPTPAWARLAASGWTGLVLLVVGALLAVTTFMDSTIAATLGLALMGVGLWRFVGAHGETMSRRLSARRTPAGRPLPPRIPPPAE